jgi:2-polyprenyl-6-hydroxyphenyl methylase/3-demethylubiquinone-9 3-methyltransferase
MWRALENLAAAVADSGLLFISVYNHQPVLTPVWKCIKRTYNTVPRPVGALMVWGYLLLKTPVVAVRGSCASDRGVQAMADGGRRGMSAYHDAVDWVGGYPHETARPGAIIDFYRQRQFRLTRMTTVGRGSGCNQFVFQRSP